jgi:hypothetical protein
MMAGNASTSSMRHLPQTRIHSAEFFRSHQQSNAAHHAPPQAFATDDITRVGGRVHALVRPPNSGGLRPPAHQPAAFRRSNARHHPPRSPAKEFEIIRVRGRVHAVVRLRIIFSPPPTTRFVSGDLQPAPCLPLPARFEGRPHITASHGSTIAPRHPPR